MYDITTGTGDFIANGVISHNCFARSTHEWLELDSGHDFDSQIVVKTNLVDVLRRELARPSWKREHVALGTNTDPYQRAEGRYKLMPGVIRALADSGTPFSILTKGTLLRRDIPLLAEAAQRVPVGLGVSMAIWDDDLHAALEPGVPTPRARLDLVRAITDAGLPCGVFLAPVLPGLTDGVADLDAALGAIAAAGATGVTVIPLHLRPGAREWFMAWLARRPSRAGAALRAAVRPARLRAGRVPHLAGRAGGAAAGGARAGPARSGGAARADRRAPPPASRATRRSGSRRAACRPTGCPVSTADRRPRTAQAARRGGAARAALRRRPQRQPRCSETRAGTPTVRSRRCRHGEPGPHDRNVHPRAAGRRRSTGCRPTAGGRRTTPRPCSRSSTASVPDAPRHPRRPSRGAPRTGNRLAEAAGYAGAVLIGAAGAVLVGEHWEALGRPGRVAVLAGDHAGPRRGGRRGRAGRPARPRRPAAAGARGPPAAGQHGAHDRGGDGGRHRRQPGHRAPPSCSAPPPPCWSWPSPSGWRRARSARPPASRAVGTARRRRPRTRRGASDAAVAASPLTLVGLGLGGAGLDAGAHRSDARAGARPRPGLYTGGLGAFYGTQPEEGSASPSWSCSSSAAWPATCAPAGGPWRPRPPWRWRCSCSG